MLVSALTHAFLDANCEMLHHGNMNWFLFSFKLRLLGLWKNLFCNTKAYFISGCQEISEALKKQAHHLRHSFEV